MWRSLAVGQLPVADVVDGLLGLDVARMTTTLQRRFQPLKGQGIFRRVGREKGVDPALLAAVARWESAFDPDAVGPDVETPGGGVANAKGLMQLMPSNVEALGLADRWRDPEANVRGGAQVLRWFDVHEVPLVETLAGYGGFDEDVRGPADDPQIYANRIAISWLYFRVREGLTP